MGGGLMDASSAMALLSAMMTPAVLISACGLLILSTSARLARVADRVRGMSQSFESLFAGPATPAMEMRRRELPRQLALQTRRARLIQRGLMSIYVALGLFVATTISIVPVALVPRLAWLPTLLGVTGTLVLFAGCVLLVGETRLAVRSIDLETQFVHELQELYRGGRDHGVTATPAGRAQST